VTQGQAGRGVQASRVRLPRREELVNVLEFEDVAKLALEPSVVATIAGNQRAGFDRITFRPRMMVPTLDLDLEVMAHVVRASLGDAHARHHFVGATSGAAQRIWHQPLLSVKTKSVQQRPNGRAFKVSALVDCSSTLPACVPTLGLLLGAKIHVLLSIAYSPGDGQAQRIATNGSS